MDFMKVSSILPQKFPFIMVDKVIELVANERITCLKNITGNEFVFLGHFPNNAIFPGAYIIEALAQASILLFNEKKESTDTLFLLYSTKVVFKNMVVPGDQLILKVESKKVTSLGIIVDVKALVDEKVVAKGELIFSVKNNN